MQSWAILNEFQNPAEQISVSLNSPYRQQMFTYSTDNTSPGVTIEYTKNLFYTVMRHRMVGTDKLFKAYLWH